MEENKNNMPEEKATPAEPMPEMNSPQPEPPKKSNAMKWFIGIAVILILGISSYFLATSDLFRGQLVLQGPDPATPEEEGAADAFEDLYRNLSNRDFAAILESLPQSQDEAIRTILKTPTKLYEDLENRTQVSGEIEKIHEFVATTNSAYDQHYENILVYLPESFEIDGDVYNIQHIVRQLAPEGLVVDALTLSANAIELIVLTPEDNSPEIINTITNDFIDLAHAVARNVHQVSIADIVDADTQAWANGVATAIEQAPDFFDTVANADLIDNLSSSNDLVQFVVENTDIKAHPIGLTLQGFEGDYYDEILTDLGLADGATTDFIKVENVWIPEDMHAGFNDVIRELTLAIVQVPDYPALQQESNSLGCDISQYIPECNDLIYEYDQKLWERGNIVASGGDTTTVDQEIAEIENDANAISCTLVDAPEYWRECEDYSREYEQLREQSAEMANNGQDTTTIDNQIAQLTDQASAEKCDLGEPQKRSCEDIATEYRNESLASIVEYIIDEMNAAPADTEYYLELGNKLADELIESAKQFENTGYACQYLATSASAVDGFLTEALGTEYTDEFEFIYNQNDFQNADVDYVNGLETDSVVADNPDYNEVLHITGPIHGEYQTDANGKGIYIPEENYIGEDMILDIYANPNTDSGIIAVSCTNILPECWDSNTNGLKDSDEDLNEDGEVDDLDCEVIPEPPVDPVVSCYDTDGDGVYEVGDENNDGVIDENDCDYEEPTEPEAAEPSEPPELECEDINNDGVIDNTDCFPEEVDIAACWDLNDNGQRDVATEDQNNDGVVDIRDCSGTGSGLGGADLYININIEDNSVTEINLDDLVDDYFGGGAITNTATNETGDVNVNNYVEIISQDVPAGDLVAEITSPARNNTALDFFECLDPVTPVSFTDIANAYYAYEPVQTSARLGYENQAITIGYPQGVSRVFRDKSNITRAELNKMVAFASCIYPYFEQEGIYDELTNRFNDNSANDWFYRQVNASANGGLIQGYTDGTFKPNQPITRAEATKIIVEIYLRIFPEKQLGSCTNSPFKDVFPTEWYCGYAGTAFREGIVLGSINSQGDHLFRPNASITRGEVAVILYNFFITTLQNSLEDTSLQ